MSEIINPRDAERIEHWKKSSMTLDQALAYCAQLERDKLAVDFEWQEEFEALEKRNNELKSALAAAQAEIERLKGVHAALAGWLSENIEWKDEEELSELLMTGFGWIDELRGMAWEEIESKKAENAALKRELEAICAIVTSDENTSALHAVEKYAAEKLRTERELEEARAERDRAKQEWREDFEVRTHLLSERDAAIASKDQLQSRVEELEGDREAFRKLLKRTCDIAQRFAEEMATHDWSAILEAYVAVGNKEDAARSAKG